MTGETSNRILTLDYVRGFAILCVILSHTTLAYVFLPRDVVIDGVLHTIFMVGVPLFFFMSGYLMAFKQPPFARFVRSRLLRIYLPAVVWTIVFSLVAALVGTTRSEVDVPGLVRDILFMTSPGYYYFILVVLILNLAGYWLLNLSIPQLKIAAQVALVLNLLTIVVYEVLIWTTVEGRLDAGWMFRNPLAWVFFFVYGIYVSRADPQFTDGLFGWLNQHRRLGIGLTLVLWAIAAVEGVILYPRFHPGGQDYFKVASFLYELLALCYVVLFFKNYEGRGRKALLVLAHYSFFIYLIHIPVADRLLGTSLQVTMGMNFHYIGIVVTTIAMIVVALAFVIPMRFLRSVPSLHNLIAILIGWPDRVKSTKKTPAKE